MLTITARRCRTPKPRSPRPLRILGLTLTLLIAGCSGALTPIEQPIEDSLAPSQATQWQALEQLRQDNWFHVLNNGADALDWRLRAIDSAVESLDLQTFIWELDNSGKLVREHILAAAQRGVRVRVLVDDSFTSNADEVLLQLDQHPHIELKVFNPYKHRASRSSLRVALNLGEFWRLDHRMHNKVMLVDDRAAVAGGRNIGDHYFGYHELANFRDLELIVGGPIVSDLSQAFDDYWNSPWSFPMEAMMEARGIPDTAIELSFTTDQVYQWHREESAAERAAKWRAIASSGHSGSARLLADKPPQASPQLEQELPTQLAAELLQVIDSAREQLWLVSAYLIPTPQLEAAIDRALARGVRVRILTNSINSNNHISAHAAYRNHVRELVIKGAEVHEVREDARERDRYIQSPVADKTLTLHAKIMLVDQDRLFIGSANLDPRSLRLNTEMGLLIDSPSLNRELRALLEPDFSEANAWRLDLDQDEQLVWHSDTEVYRHQPADSFMRSLEDWFLAHLPIENEM